MNRDIERSLREEVTDVNRWTGHCCTLQMFPSWGGMEWAHRQEFNEAENGT